MDEDVIDVGRTELVEVLSQRVVDVSLESSWRTSQTKRGNQLLEKPISRTKGSFPLVPFLDTDLVECGNYVQLRKLFCF